MRVGFPNSKEMMHKLRRGTKCDLAMAGRRRKEEAADEPEVPWSERDFEEMAKSGTSAAAYERKNKPFSPPTGRVPTIGEQWAYAARRYSKYQGYAWSGVVAVAAIAYFGSLATQPTKPQQPVKTKPGAGR